MSTPANTDERLAGALRSEGRRVRFRRGQALFTEGDLADRVFVVEGGRVIITSIAPGGREIVLAGRLRDADRKRLEFAALDTLGRVAWRLQELGERFGEDTADGIEVELPLSQEQLASWCGGSREATVKALAALRTLGCISTARRSVLIRDAEALRRHAYSL